MAINTGTMLSWLQLLALHGLENPTNKYAVCLKVAIAYYYDVSDITAQEVAHQCGQLGDIFCSYGEHEFQFTFREFLLLHQSGSVLPTSLRSSENVQPEVIYNLAEWLCGRPAGLQDAYRSLLECKFQRIIG